MTADGSDRSFGAPRFDVVLRGYDRRQVDEHLSRLNRVLARMRGDLDAARSRPAAPPPLGVATPAGGRPRPTPRPRPDGLPPSTEGPDVVGSFTERMQTILQSAEEEAAEIRAQARQAVRAEEERLTKARAATRAEEEAARAAIANLVRQRDEVLADLTRMRGQLEALLSGPTARISVPAQTRPAGEGVEGTVAAARRDPAAGQPLPGAAADAVAPASTDIGPEGTVAAAAVRPGAATSERDAADEEKPAPDGPAAKAAPEPEATDDGPGADDGVTGTTALRPARRETEATVATPAATATPAPDAEPADPAAEDADGDGPVERTTAALPAEKPAEQTALLDPAEQGDDPAPRPGEATVKVAAVPRRTPTTPPSPAQTEHASASRST
jgi:DivIVA domain-containing protein